MLIETIVMGAESKAGRYSELLPQLASLAADENDIVALLANLSAALKSAFSCYSWIGFYILKGNELVVGPFQGKVACSRIRIGSGVCGTAAKEKRSVIVPDVSLFPGHIACDPDSKSEIVIPILQDGKVFGVLDADSKEIGSFDSVDQSNLERIVELIIVPKIAN